MDVCSRKNFVAAVVSGRTSLNEQSQLAYLAATSCAVSGEAGHQKVEQEQSVWNKIAAIAITATVLGDTREGDQNRAASV